MSKVLTCIKVARTNWKKSVFALAAVSYVADFTNTEYKKNSLVREYCKKASQYGDVPLQVFGSPRHVAVILNPAANKREGLKEYEKYCAPLLHLAGISVTLLVTNKDMDAINITTKIPIGADAVIIAGGDGTVSEVITGLLRLRNDNGYRKVLPVGILPLGKTNSLAKKLYASNTESSDKLFRFRVMMDATYSVINEITKHIDVMEIRNIDTADHLNHPDEEFRPVYAVSSIQLGAFRDAHAKIDKYWYLGKLRSLAPYVFESFHRNNINAQLNYSSPCSGCAKCYKHRNDLSTGIQSVEQKRWWHAFIPRFQKSLGVTDEFVDYEKIENQRCAIETEILVDTIDLSVSPKIANGVPALHIDIGPKRIPYLDFIKDGWSRESNNTSISRRKTNQSLSAQKLHLTPIDESADGKYLSIDNEEYELKKIAVTLLHNIIAVFHSPSLKTQSSKC